MVLGKKVNPYVVDIKDICVKIFSQDRSNKAKVETFPLLAQVYAKSPHYYALLYHLEISTLAHAF